MFTLRYSLIFIFLAGFFFLSEAHVNPESGPRRSTNVQAASEKEATLRADCAQATSQIEMDINNVRARLLNGGDVWWDLQDGKYIVPKVEPGSGVPEKSSIFAGAVWLGGFDPAGNLKLAAQTYRQQGNDFWPGPLRPDDGLTDEEVCADWNRHFEVEGTEIKEHLRLYNAAISNGTDYKEEDIPRKVRGWPARGNRFFFDINGFELPNTTQGLAAFFDNDGDGNYEPDDGDFPRIEVRGCDAPQFPDQMIFWIYNDAGGSHTQTRGNPIQMEVQVQAFAYATNDEINNMTFQRYKLINRASDDIDSTFFAMWVDPDLGCYEDDYVGCDVERSMAYVYNEDPLDGNPGCSCPQGVNTYCDEVPLLGVDYFRGPLDENGDEIGMSSFTYYNNGGVGSPPPGTDDPEEAVEYYRYMSGSWKDGTPFSEGGNGYNIGGAPIPYSFFNTPDDQDGWSMCTAGLPFGDRRTIQASGPFKLEPGAVNELIIGVVWVANQDYPCPDISELQFADEIAQSLFDNCFEITDGPDAPDVDWIELDKELIAILTNDEISSNNAFEAYEALDLQAPPSIPDEEKMYKFEGYKTYQLAGPEVGPDELDDFDKARLIFQVDLENGVDKIFNWRSVTDPNSKEKLWFPVEQVAGKDDGILHTFRITEDQFGTDVRTLINHKKYYFTTIAYAYNNYDTFDPNTTIGQRRSYLEGRNNIKVYTPIPRPVTYEKLNSKFGDGAIITRLDGVGVGGNALAISEESENAILGGSSDGAITYREGKGPIAIKIYNPLDVVDGEFQLSFTDMFGNNDGNSLLDNERYWTLKRLDVADDAIIADQTIDKLNEQIIKEYGFSIAIQQTDDVGDNTDATNGFIGSEIEYKEADKPKWIQTVPDGDGVFNYILTGFNEADANFDPNEALSKGVFVPYFLCDWRNRANQEPYISPAWNNTNNSIVRARTKLQDLNNVDVVLTPDKSKWSRCVVIETATEFYTSANGTVGLPSEGNAKHFDVRKSPSLGKDGQADNDGIGMSWFPGYAIDVETGKRLNIFFGENSTYDGSLFGDAFDNGLATGRDMMWNPTAQVFLNTGQATLYNFLAGAQHFIYVSNTEYDECADIREKLDPVRANNRPLEKVKVLDDVSWTTLPVLVPGTQLLSYAEGVVPNEVRIKLRVDNPYDVTVGTNVNKGYPTYEFKLEGKAASDVESTVEIAQALQAINIVPNPYYGFSAYETSQFTTRVKITNLPAKCTVTIYSLDGKFIRQYKRDEAGVNQRSLGRNNPAIEQTQIAPALEWDLKNNKGIPIASGVYLVHVDAGELGERILKWFGVNRQFDPSGL